MSSETVGRGWGEGSRKKFGYSNENVPDPHLIINDSSLIVDKYHTSENGSDLTINSFLSCFWG